MKDIRLLLYNLIKYMDFNDKKYQKFTLTKKVKIAL